MDYQPLHQPPKSNFPHYHFAILLAVAICSIFFTIWATAGTLTPSSAPGATMKTLQEIYDSVAGTSFSSSGITADQNGSLIEGLKYLNNNIFVASSSSGFYFTPTSRNVGIGTTAPIRALDIYGSSWVNGSGGDLRVVGSNTVGGAITLIAYPNASVETAFSILATGPGANAGSGSLAIWDNLELAYRFLVSPAGNIGIGGTLTPDQKLDVKGNILASSSGNVDLILRSSTTRGVSNNDDAKFVIRTGSSSERFEIINGAGTKLVTIASGGNIGIGSGLPYPGSIVSVTGTVVGINQTTVPFSYDEFIGALGALPASKTWSSYSNRELRVQSFNADAGFYGQAILYNGRFTHATSGTPPYSVFHQGNFQRASGIIFDGGDTMFIVNPGPTGSGSMPMAEAFRIKNTGNIGVGTSSPATRFAVVGSAGNYDIFNVASSSGTSLFRISKGGNVGIGTTTPTAALHLVGDTGTLFRVATGSNGRFSVQEAGLTTITNTSTSTGVGSIFRVMVNSMSQFAAMSAILTDDSAAADEYFLAMQSDIDGTPDSEFLFTTNGNGLADGSFTGGGADVAEWMPTLDKSLEAGDLVVIDGVSSKSYVKKSPGVAHDSSVIGIISTAPGLVAGGGDADAHGDLSKTNALVALAGRVPLKFSAENGHVQPGDHLTSSSIPGVAMKATRPGMTVGIALEASDPGRAAVMVFVKVGYWMPEGTEQVIYAPITDPDGKSIISEIIGYLQKGVVLFKKIIADEVETKRIKSEKVELIGDDGSTYCIRIIGGSLQSVKGECSAQP